MPSAFLWASAHYRPRPYGGSVALLLSDDVVHHGRNLSAEWREIAPKVTVHPRPGSHLECITAYVDTLAKTIPSCLQSVAGSCASTRRRIPAVLRNGAANSSSSTTTIQSKPRDRGASKFYESGENFLPMPPMAGVINEPLPSAGSSCWTAHSPGPLARGSLKSSTPCSIPRNKRAPRGFTSNAIGGIDVAARGLSPPPPRLRSGRTSTPCWFSGTARQESPRSHRRSGGTVTLCFNLSHSAGSGDVRARVGSRRRESISTPRAASSVMATAWPGWRHARPARANC